MTDYQWEGYSARAWQYRLGVPAVYLYDVVDSTNNTARDLAEQGAPSLTLVLADYQTSGRGRAGRSWFARPGGSLLFSVVFRTPPGEQFPGTAPVRIGHAVAVAIEAVTGHDMRVKWPNDVVLYGRGKIAGILCEGVVRQQGHAYIVAGIGINVSATGAGFTALADAGPPPARGVLLEEIVARLHELADNVVAPLSDAERAALQTRDLLFDKVVQTEEGTIGRARGIAPDGSLLLATKEGVRAVQSATIRVAGTGAYPGSSE